MKTSESDQNISNVWAGILKSHSKSPTATQISLTNFMRPADSDACDKGDEYIPKFPIPADRPIHNITYTHHGNI